MIRPPSPSPPPLSTRRASPTDAGLRGPYSRGRRCGGKEIARGGPWGWECKGPTGRGVFSPPRAPASLGVPRGPVQPGWGWGRPSPRMVEGQSLSPSSPAPNTPASSGRRRPARWVCAGSPC